MNRHDAVFWFGDLNYRVQPLADVSAVEEMKKLVRRSCLVAPVLWNQVIAAA